MALALTAAGIAAGYTLEVFASGFPNTSGNPVRTVFGTLAGGAVVGNQPNGRNYTFPGLSAGQAASAYVAQSSLNSFAYARANGIVYTFVLGSASPTRYDLWTVSDDGTLGAFVVSLPDAVIPLSPFAVNCGGNAIYVPCSATPSTVNPIYKINLNTLAVSLWLATGGGAGNYGNGSAINIDDTILYITKGNVALSRGVYAYDMATATLLYTSPVDSSLSAGVACLIGDMDGSVIYNATDSVKSLNTAGSVVATIAIGASRMEYISVFGDRKAYISDYDCVYRLTAPPGSEFYRGYCGGDDDGSDGGGDGDGEDAPPAGGLPHGWSRDCGGLPHGFSRDCGGLPAGFSLDAGPVPAGWSRSDSEAA